jgi:ankyrin repeat protein
LAVTGRLCEAGAETCILNKEGKSCLNLAAAHADVATLRRLFKKKLEAAQDVYIRDFLQVTPLIDATKAGNLKKIHELVRRKVSVLITDDQGNTPLHWVVIHNNPQTAARLAKANRIFDPVHLNIDTPLTLTAKNGYGTVFGTLIKYSSD